MDMEKVFSLFRLFYNEEDAESFLPVAEVAEDSARLEYAQRLYKSYENLCTGLIRDDGFLFLRTE